MGFGTPPTVLEGDYSTWTPQKWVSTSLTNLDDINFGGIQGDRVFIRSDSGRTAILNLTNGTIVSEEVLTFYDATGKNIDLVHSIHSKYVVVQETETKFRVYKDGSLQQTVEVLGVYWSGFVISSNGQYVIAIDYNAKKVYCFEGS